MIYSPSAAFLQTAGVVFADQVEHLWRIDLDQNLRVLGAELVGAGDDSMVRVRAAQVFRGALVVGSSRIVIAHNHPKGVAVPSSRDRIETQRIGVVGSILGVQLLDHILVGAETLFSFKEKGLI